MLFGKSPVRAFPETLGDAVTKRLAALDALAADVKAPQAVPADAGPVILTLTGRFETWLHGTHELMKNYDPELATRVWNAGQSQGLENRLDARTGLRVRLRRARSMLVGIPGDDLLSSLGAREPAPPAAAAPTSGNTEADSWRERVEQHPLVFAVILLSMGFTAGWLCHAWFSATVQVVRAHVGQ